MTQWRWQPILDSYLVVLVAAAVLMGVLLLPETFGSLSRRRRRVLLTLRGLVVAVLILAMLNPTRISLDKKSQTSLLVLLLDRSRSMQFPDASGQRSRWQALRQAFEASQESLRAMGESIEVKIYLFDGQLEALAEIGAELPESPLGDLTDLGGALQKATRQDLGRRFAGVVLISDGVQTAFNPSVELYDAAREMSRLGAPLYSVALGPAGDISQSRDVAVENFPEQYTVFVQNQLVVRGVVKARGYAGQALQLELLATNPAGKTDVVQRQSVTSAGEDSQTPIELLFTPNEPGQFKLTLRAAEQPGELVVKNNELTAFVNVLDGGLRVAYLYGERMGEQRALRWSLESSPDIELDSLYIDRRQRGSWPLDRGELFAPDKYDVYLVENLDSTALKPANWEALASVVSAGKGLLMIGGYQSFSPGGYQQTKLNDVLPVVMDRLERQAIEIDKPISTDLHWPASANGISMLPLQDHPLLQLGPPERNLQIWRGLPPLTGANRLVPKTQAQVLAAGPGQEPLLISGEYGAGRVLAFAGDSTRLWWQFGQQLEHKRYWRQTVLWLARRDGLEKNEVWVRLPRRRLQRGEQADLAAGARTAAGDPLTDVQWETALIDPSGGRKEIALAARGEEFAATSDPLMTPGNYRVQAVAKRAGAIVGSAETAFEVLDRDLELIASAADPAQMQRLAAETADLGGRLVAVEELPELLAQIAANPPEVAVQFQSRWQLAGSWWDAWLVFLALAALLIAEWTCRKMWGLV